MDKTFITLLLLLALSLSACSSGAASPTLTPTLPPADPPTEAPPTATSRPTATATAMPTVTATPSETPLPTPALFVLPGTPLPLPLQILTAGNAPAISGLSEWQEKSVTDLAWAPDGRTLAAATDNGIVFYDAQTRLRLRSLYPRDEPIVSLAFSQDGAWLAAGSRRGSEKTAYASSVELWQGPDWRPIGLIYGEPRGLTRVAFSPNHVHFAAAFSSPEPLHDSSIEFWNTKTWQVTGTLNAGTVIDLAFSPDGQLLATTPDRYAIKLWNLKKGGQLFNLPTSFTGAVSALAFAPGGGLLATGHYDGAIRFWDVTTGQLVRLLYSQGAVQSLAFSSDGSLLASGDSYSEQVVDLWAVATGELLKRLTGHTHAVDHLRFSLDGQLLASSSYDGTIRLWGIRR